MAKKRKEKSLLSKVVATLLMFSVLFYSFNAAIMAFIGGMGKFEETFTDYQSVIHFMLYSDDLQNRMVAAVLAVVVTVLLSVKMFSSQKQYKNAHDFGLHGTARFAELSEYIESGTASKNNHASTDNPFKTLKVEEGIILGAKPDSNELLIIPNDTKLDNLNTLVVGSAGSGKGQAFVFPNMINIKNKSLVVVDPKGEIYEGTHQLKRDQGYKIIRIDFVDLMEGGFNPLQSVQTTIDAQKVANDISNNCGEDVKKDFFFYSAVSLYVGLILYCKDKYKDPSMTHVKNEYNKLLADPEYLKAICANLELDHPAYQFLIEHSAHEPKVLSNILSSLSQQTSVFNDIIVSNFTKQSSFSFEDIVNEKTVLYVKMSMRENPLKALTATFFTQMIDTFYKIADRNNGVLPIETVSLMEEFANVGKINDYGKTLSTCRAMGLSFITVVQDLAQFEALYGKVTMRNIINNHDIHLYLRTRDQETAKYFESQAGITTAEYKGRSNSSGTGWLSSKAPSQSTSEQYSKRPLLTVDEIINIPKDDCVAFISGHHPIQLKKAYQFIFYKGFLTEGKGNWVYEHNRKKYIKLLEKQGVVARSSQKNKVQEKLTLENDLGMPDNKDERIVDGQVEEETKNFSGEGIHVYGTKNHEEKHTYNRYKKEDLFDLHTLESDVKEFISKIDMESDQKQVEDLMKSSQLLLDSLDSDPSDLLSNDAIEEFLNNET